MWLSASTFSSYALEACKWAQTDLSLLWSLSPTRVTVLCCLSKESRASLVTEINIIQVSSTPWTSHSDEAGLRSGWHSHQRVGVTERHRQSRWCSSGQDCGLRTMRQRGRHLWRGLDIKKKNYKSGEIWADVAQMLRGGGCSVPGVMQGQPGWGPEQSDWAVPCSWSWARWLLRAPLNSIPWFTSLFTVPKGSLAWELLNPPTLHFQQLSSPICASQCTQQASLLYSNPFFPIMPTQTRSCQLH